MVRWPACGCSDRYGKQRARRCQRASGQYPLAIAARVLAWFATGGGARIPPFPELTARKREVLDLLAQGLTNAAIATRLVVSDKTVRNHVSNVFAKLHVTDRAAAVALARDAGLGRAVQ